MSPRLDLLREVARLPRDAVRAWLCWGWWERPDGPKHDADNDEGTAKADKWRVRPPQARMELEAEAPLHDNSIAVISVADDEAAARR